MGKIHLDTSGWPIPVVTPEGVADSAELSAFFEAYVAMFRQRNEPYCIIIDLRRAGDMPAAQRKVLTDYMKTREQTAALYCAGTALVFESALMRAILTAVFWVRKPPQEVCVFATVADAQLWAKQALARKARAA